MPAADTRTQLLDASYSLMLAKGYVATGVDEICRQAGVSKGSFYHFFKTKQQCAMEMLDHHMAEAQSILEEGLVLTGLDAWDAAIGYVKHVEELSEKVFQDGCLIGAFALELAETHPELREQVSRFFRGTAAHFEKLFAPVCEISSLADMPMASDLADQMLTSIEGGVVLSKAHSELRYVSQGIRLFRHYLESLRARDAALVAAKT